MTRPRNICLDYSVQYVVHAIFRVFSHGSTVHLLSLIVSCCFTVCVLFIFVGIALVARHSTKSPKDTFHNQRQTRYGESEKRIWFAASFRTHWYRSRRHNSTGQLSTPSLPPPSPVKGLEMLLGSALKCCRHS